MTDSSPEKSETTGTPAVDDKKVPIQAVAKERAEKRAAREQVQKLSAELETARQAAGFDEDTMNQVVEQLTLEARKAVEAELKPVQDEVSKWKMAAKLGLNEDQVNKVMEIRMQNPNLNENQALVLARSEHSELFPTQQTSKWSPALGGLPVSGNPDRMGDKPDFVAKMHEAARAGDRQAAKDFATQEALSRFRTAFLQSRTR